MWKHYIKHLITLVCAVDVYNRVLCDFSCTVEEEEMIKCEQTLSKSVNDIESELPSAKRTRIE